LVRPMKLSAHVNWAVLCYLCCIAHPVMRFPPIVLTMWSSPEPLRCS
jgi:hypothetical protein